MALAFIFAFSNSFCFSSSLTTSRDPLGLSFGLTTAWILALPVLRTRLWVRRKASPSGALGEVSGDLKLDLDLSRSVLGDSVCDFPERGLLTSSREDLTAALMGLFGGLGLLLFGRLFNGKGLICGGLIRPAVAAPDDTAEEDSEASESLRSRPARSAVDDLGADSLNEFKKGGGAMAGFDLGPSMSIKSPNLLETSGSVSAESSLFVELRLNTVSDLGLPPISKSSFDFTNH